METPRLIQLTKRDLIRKVWRKNVESCVLGAFACLLSVLLEIVTLYLLIVFVAGIRNPFDFQFHFPALWKHCDGICLGILFFFLIFQVVLTFQGNSLFFVADAEIEIPGDPVPLPIHFKTGSSLTLLGTILCLAPLSAFWGVGQFSRCLRPGPRQLDLALALYDYLKDWGKWAPYPKILSQRQGIALLYHLDLVRISRRFGRLEVKIASKKRPFR